MTALLPEQSVSRWERVCAYESMIPARGVAAAEGVGALTRKRNRDRQPGPGKTGAGETSKHAQSRKGRRGCAQRCRKAAWVQARNPSRKRLAAGMK